MDGGGLFTRFFDDSSLPEGSAPGEGPFRQIPVPGAVTAGASEGTGADSDGDIRIHLVYYNAGERRNAERAKLTINYRDGDNDIVRTVYRTVPAGGVVRVPCPGTGEYIRGSGLVPTTAEVYAQKNIVNFYLGRGDCGEIQQISARHSVYIPWRNLDSVIPLIENHFDQYRERIAFEVDFNMATARYYGSSDRITFGSGDYQSVWVAAHEFGHGFHHKALGGLWTTQNCSSHDIDQGSSYTCALSEGFADYAANVGRGDPQHWEYKHYTDSGYDDAEIEGNIAALLHDLIDSNADSSDRTSYPADYIADVFETCRAGGRKRNDVTDLVWCLENRVNEDVHDSGFPRGPDAPPSASESATEPGTWNVAHIRAVWWKNVT